MTPQRERELHEQMSRAARQTPSCELMRIFDSAVENAETIQTQFGYHGIDAIGDEAQIEFTILRHELEVRNLIRFH